MPQLDLPKEHHSKFVSFIQMPKDVKSQIFKHLNNYKQELDPSLIVEYLVSKIKNQSREQLLDVVLIFLNLAGSINSIDIPVKEFLPILEQALLRTENPELVPDESVLADFEHLLLSGSVLATQAKVVNLMSENQHTFLDARIIQDVRVSFDQGNTLEGSAIIHNLKIAFKADNEGKEFFVSLDDNDLAKLSNEIKKAQENAQLIINSFPNGKFIKI